MWKMFLADKPQSTELLYFRFYLSYSQCNGNLNLYTNCTACVTSTTLNNPYFIG